MLRNWSVKDFRRAAMSPWKAQDGFMLYFPIT